MAKFDAAIDRNVFLKKATQDKAWTPFVSNGGARLPYGLGWFVEEYRGVKLLWHYGHWGTGFSAIYLKVPEKNLSLVMLTNSEALADHQFLKDENPVKWGIARNVFACNFLRVFVFEDRPTDCERDSQAALTKWIEHRRTSARVAVQVDPQVLETYVGQYQFEFDPSMILTMTTEGGKLFVDVPRDHKTELLAASPSTFFFKIRPAQVRFMKKGGQVTGIEWDEHGETLPAHKIK